ncbi:guanylate kinase [Beijerinckia sp. L45]|uniref:guanylate kinase n=1 Tax=Beijerinckia sp. L45 TaxID=1641855 RepID=UPI00131D9E92|nr:guanylate kinase [Beijerinckia sp. L45]
MTAEEQHLSIAEVADEGSADGLRRGFILILSSPSGAGKTTLTRLLLERQELDLTLSISVTTRSRRSSEIDGIHYRFIKQKQFEALREADDLLEWAEVHGNFYGTPREPVELILSQGRDVLFDIDYQGTQQVKAKGGMDVVTIFILPPSMQELQARLERRAEDPAETIARRLANARNEIRRWTQYDYVLINDDIQDTFSDLLAIIEAERRKTSRSKEAIGRFVDELLE